jgi:hypothetical protein
MIWDSCYWKDHLIKEASVLRRRKGQRRWSEASFARLEQTVMVGFYSIRKLMEASKLSDATVRQQVQLTVYPCTGKTVTKMNWHKINELYDLEAASTQLRDLMFLCHQFIHTHVFLPVFDENRFLHSILFTSDRHRHQWLHSLEVVCIVDLFERVGSDYPNEVKMTYNPAKQDYDVTAVTHTGGSWVC